MQPDVFRIGLVMTHSLAFFRDILRGVKTFAMERSGWIFTPIAPDKRALELAQSLRCDGYLAHIYSQPLADALLSLKKPVVNVSGVLPALPIPRVVVDHQEVGRQAARHLLERGVTQFGFVGYPQHQFSLEREQGFHETVLAAGFCISTFHERTQKIQDPTGLWTWNQPLMNWLTELPKPVGLLASHDTQGAQVSEYCRQLRLRVPDDVAIVGVDDDDLLCELARPSLSSVALPGERIGYEAARLLDKCLQGMTPDPAVIVLQPGEVVVRQSSDLLAVTDLEVRAAMRFIHEHAHQPIRVPDVLKIVPVARRGLERRFRKSLNRSISEEIRRVHLDRSRKLLLGTDLPIATVAQLAGFQDGRQLCITFRAETGLTPTAYRHKFRLRS